MKPTKFFCVMIFVSFCIGMGPATSHKAIFVFDGDTIQINKIGKIRYLGINTLEMDHKDERHTPLARAAKFANQALVGGKQVRLEYDQEKTDRHGRVLAYVFLENGDMVNAILVRKGLAHVMFNRADLKYGSYLLDCQRKAMTERLGMWHRQDAGEEKRYVGNASTYRFHKQGCPFASKIGPRNRQEFKSRYDAFWAGYSPCGHCRP